MRSYIARYSYRVLHVRRIRSMVVRIRLDRTRDNPTTVKSKSVSTGENVAATSTLHCWTGGHKSQRNVWTINQTIWKKKLRNGGEDQPFQWRIKELITAAYCALYWKLKWFSVHAGTCMQLTEQNRQFNKNRFDVLSIPGYVMKKDQSDMDSQCVR